MNLRVVLADDDPDIQLLARVALKRAQFDVTIAGNGREALEQVAAIKPDLVLLDWLMPEMDGPETCARLKADPATHDIPVIFLTAKAQEAEIQRGLSLGAIGYVAKPFNPMTLGEHVRGLLTSAPPRTT